MPREAAAIKADAGEMLLGVSWAYVEVRNACL